MSAPWDFSKGPQPGEPTQENLPTAVGRELGAGLARWADIEEAKQREQFPNMLPRCNDCALRAGTRPNGCEETLMDALKCAAEGVPFFCHKGVQDGDEPTRLCTGVMVLMNEKSRSAIGRIIAKAKARVSR